METGYIKSVFREPNWELRSKEDRSVEKVIFLKNGQRLNGGVCPLVSIHADGYFRIWNAMEGKMIVEFDCQMAVDEGLTSMACNEQGTLLIIGGTFGHVRLIDLEAVLMGSYEDEENEAGKRDLAVIHCWRGHLTGISSCNFVDQNEMVLTGSVDCAIRLWSFDGSHVGTFGDQQWNFYEPSQRVLPRDLQHQIEINELMNRSEEKQRNLTSKNIIKNWQGKTFVMGKSPNELLLLAAARASASSMSLASLGSAQALNSNVIEERKTKAVKVYVGNLFRDYWKMEQNMMDWKINPNIVSIKNQKVGDT